jgi:hypothetical protein
LQLRKDSCSEKYHDEAGAIMIEREYPMICDE